MTDLRRDLMDIVDGVLGTKTRSAIKEGITPAPLAMRWWVARAYLHPTRLGERTEGIVWAVWPCVGRGKQRRLTSNPSYFASRLKAIAYAQREAQRIYGRSRR